MYDFALYEPKHVAVRYLSFRPKIVYFHCLPEVVPLNASSYKTYCYAARNSFESDSSISSRAVIRIQFSFNTDRSRCLTIGCYGRRMGNIVTYYYFLVSEQPGGGPRVDCLLIISAEYTISVVWRVMSRIIPIVQLSPCLVMLSIKSFINQIKLVSVTIDEVKVICRSSGQTPDLR